MLITGIWNTKGKYQAKFSNNNEMYYSNFIFKKLISMSSGVLY